MAMDKHKGTGKTRGRKPKDTKKDRTVLYLSEDQTEFIKLFGRKLGLNFPEACRVIINSFMNGTDVKVVDRDPKQFETFK